MQFNSFSPPDGHVPDLSLLFTLKMSVPVDQIDELIRTFSLHNIKFSWTISAAALVAYYAM